MHVVPFQLDLLDVSLIDRKWEFLHEKLGTASEVFGHLDTHQDSLDRKYFTLVCDLLRRVVDEHLIELAELLHMLGRLRVK